MFSLSCNSFYFCHYGVHNKIKGRADKNWGNRNIAIKYKRK